MRSEVRGVKDTVWFRRKPDGSRENKPMDSDEKVWEILLSADKKDYERICVEYGITNFRGMLTRLSEMKKEKEAEVAQVGLCSPNTSSYWSTVDRWRTDTGVRTLRRMLS